MASSFLEQMARQQAEKLEKQYGSSAYGGTTWLNEQLGKKKKKDEEEDDIAPVVTTKKDEERTWFQKGAFEDGYQFGDVTKTILGSFTDVSENLATGVVGMGEKVVDALAWVSPYLAQGQFYQNGGDLAPLETQKAFNKSIEQSKTEMEKFIEKDLYDEEKVAKTIVRSDFIKKTTGIDAETDSVFGEKSDSLVQSAGQLGATIGLQAVGVPWFVTTGVTSFGGETENALKQGASMEEAGLSAAITAGAEILSEKLSGGISFGGKTLDDLWVKQLTSRISDKTLRTLAKIGIDAVGEGSEEIVSQVFSNLGSSLYREESLSELLASEEAIDEYIESFIGGAVLGGGSSVVGAIKDSKAGVDTVTGMTANEQKVIDKVVEDRIAEEESDGKKLTNKEKEKIHDAVVSDMEKGYISTDTIEEVLGGETYKAYKDTVDSEDALQKEFDTLNKMKQGEMTGEQIDRRAELKAQLEEIKTADKRNQMKSKLGEEVFGLVQSDRLAESYNERGRRSQAFEVDLKQYDAKQQETVKKAVESGILNNTRRTHEFVDMIAKITADKGVLFDFTNNEKLKGSVFAVDGKQVNGYVTKDGVTLNIDSAKALNSVVGHEITHVLEGTEMYNALQQTIVEYAKSKGDYQGRYDALAKLYEGVKDANVDAELTADLVGDYLFTDPEFINNLSTNHRNVFQKIYDEIKYLAKVATAGSKEARELEKVKRAFEKAYQESGKAQKNTAENSGVKYDLNATDIAREYIEYTDFEQTNAKITEKVSDLVRRGVTVPLSSESISNYETRADWTDKKAVRKLLKEVLEPHLGVSVQFEQAGNTLTAYLTRDGINHSVGGFASPRKAAAFEMFNSLVKNSEYAFSSKNDVHSNKNKKIDGNIEWDTFVSVGTINGESYPVVFKVRTIDADVRSQIYEMATKNETGLPHGDGSQENPTDAHPNYGSSPISGDNIPQTEPTVKMSLSDSGSKRLTATDVIDSLYNYDTVKFDKVVVDINVEDFESKWDRGYYHSVVETIAKHTGKSRQEVWNAFADVLMEKDGIAKVDGKTYINVHELSEDNLRKAFDLGGLAAPSIGIVDVDKPTTNFGRISLIFPDIFNPETVPTHYGDSYSTSLPAVAKFTDNTMLEDALTDGFDGMEYSGILSTEEMYDLIHELEQFYIYDERQRTSHAISENGFRNAKEFARDYSVKSIDGLRKLYNGLNGKYESYEQFLEDFAEKAFTNQRMHRYNTANPDFDWNDRAYKFRDYTLDDAVEEMTARGDDDFKLATGERVADYGELLSGGMRARLKYGSNDFYEVKPQRAVYIDEATYAVVPETTSADVIEMLESEGVKVVKYQGIDGVTDGKAEAIKGILESDTTGIRYSVSEQGEQFAPVSSFDTFGKDIRLETQEETQVESKEVLTSAPVSEETAMFPEDAPIQTEIERLEAEKAEIESKLATDIENAELNDRWFEIQDRIEALRAEEDAQQSDRLASLDDADAPPEMEAPIYEDAPFEDGQAVDVVDPFADREVPHGNEGKKVNAYMYDNPEVKPFFQAEALALMEELNNGMKGERWYNDKLYYETRGDEGFGGTKRHQSESIDRLSYEFKLSYSDIEKGLEAIIKDHGAENIAAAKKIEFVINDRLMYGYKPFGASLDPDAGKPNQDYIAMLHDKQRVDSLTDESAPPVEEDVSPVFQNSISSQQVTGQQEIPRNRTREHIGADAPGVQAENARTEQMAFFEEPEVPKTITRKELHANIVDGIKSTFKTKGFDFDKVLKDAKNLSTFATVDNTPQRVLEKALGYKEGQVLSDITVNKVAQNETEGIKWLNAQIDTLKKISKQYGIKPGSKESAAAQMYAEGFYVDENNDIISYGDAELAKDFPDTNVRQNIKRLASDTRIRQIYDDTLSAINESRTRNAYPEIPRLDNYFLHFRAMEDTFSRLGLPFNPNDIKAKDLPTDLNGVTADLKPGKPFFASEMHRTGKRTSFDLLGGVERYLNSAKNQIYHIDDIQNLRALRNYIADTYGQANGLSGLDALSEEEAQERIKEVYDSHLSTFAKFLNEEANVLAGKTALIDRGLEGIIGRRGITFLNTVNGQVGKNMVGFNISSSLTNFLPVAQTFAKTNKADFVKAFGQTVGNKVGSIFGRTDSFAENSPVVIRRKGADRFNRTPWEKVSDTGYVFMSAVDDISTELIARTKYNELVRKGMDSQKAHYETDKWVSRLMGDRSLGQQPQLYNSKMLGLITKFQLEVRNQLDSQFYDTIQEAKVSNEQIENTLARNAKTAAKVTSTFVQLAVAQHLFGKAFESVAGYNPAFDIIEVLMTAFGFDDDEDSEDTVLDNIEQGFLALLEDLPYTSTFTGGRIPISTALPIKELVTGKDEWGNEKSRWETLSEVAPYYVLPGGYGQIKKTTQGLGMFSEEHPIAGSYTDSGGLRFPVEDTIGNRIQAGIFGQYASENARDYFDNERSPLKEKQIQEFIDVDIPIRDYWDYREGLNEQETLEDKFDYIAGLDLPVEKKNILINNVVDRKNDVDMTRYEDFDSFEEFYFYSKNTEKYNFLQDNGVSYRQYTASEDAKEKYDGIYSWYTNYPDKVTVSKAVTNNVVEYREYTSALNDIRADKDANGKSISGSAKEKKAAYINGLDIDYGAKLILFKSEYNADDTYNYDIIDYLNGREDISYEEMVTILKELGFEVSGNNISW